MNEGMFHDPISGEEFTDPFLASDGYTYNGDTLCAAIASDPWHRSPMTREVLRAWAYPNNLVAAKLGCVQSVPLLLFDEGGGGANCIPKSGRPLLIGLPEVLSCDDEIVRHGWFLPPVPIVLTARLQPGDGGDLDTLMHPPCPDTMASDFHALANLFRVHRLVSNPSSLTTAVLGFGGAIEPVTVEDWWIAHFT